MKYHLTNIIDLLFLIRLNEQFIIDLIKLNIQPHLIYRLFKNLKNIFAFPNNYHIIFEHFLV